MSALARYFLSNGCTVGGYDRTRSQLTESLEREGAAIHYTDSVELIDQRFRDRSSTVVIYTPAVPADMSELVWFREQGFEVIKRSECLGHLSEGKYVMAVAGTHGKTTTTTMVAWLNSCAGGGGSAFLGGVSVNFGSNLVIGAGNRLAVEADEYDRSFLRLHPDVAVVTAADADHLDIYGTHEAVKEAFAQFIGQIKKGGTLIIKQGVDVHFVNPSISVYRYAKGGNWSEGVDFYAKNRELCPDGTFRFDMVCPDRTIEGCRLGVGGEVNVENAVAAVAMVWVAGFDEGLLREALASFRGVKRRFECYVNTPKAVYVDDYAHHPAELTAAICSIRTMFPSRRLTALFQPHLYTRTRDFYGEFAKALSLADEVVLIPIYPAREEPIAGVDSQMIARLVTVPCRVVDRDALVETVRSIDTDVVVSFGAGDIDRLCTRLAEAVAAKAESGNRQ